MKNKDLADKEVSVKLSICSECDGVIRVAVEHLMDKRSKSEFAKEVMDYNLSVKQMPLREYQKEKRKWCSCELDSTINTK